MTYQVRRKERRAAKIRKRLREQVYAKTGYRCAYCGKPPQHYTIDHVQPIARGGRNNSDNLLCACHICNEAKGNYGLKNFRAALKQDGVPMGKRKTLWYRRKGAIGRDGFYFERVAAEPAWRPEPLMAVFTSNY